MDTETIKKVQSGDIFLLTGKEMQLLLPWLRETLADQQRKPENAELCQLFDLVLRLSSRLYGTAPGTRETCICEG
ncbi:hypothetical protein [Streptomyces kronopolitis]|uniref:hypothetical protein n=1 Tax=Streptomyces kronopolitis TaxID=1612435 RepID=UPI00341939E4